MVSAVNAAMNAVNAAMNAGRDCCRVGVILGERSVNAGRERGERGERGRERVNAENL